MTCSAEPYPAFRKIPRFNRDVVITEKIDGTNGLISIREIHNDEVRRPEWVAFVDGQWYGLSAGSRNRWLSPGKETDNFGFAAWVREHASELVKLGVGHHYGEWYGQGIQRGYGLAEKRFALFHTHGIGAKPACVDVVPVLFEGTMGDLLTPDSYGTTELGYTLTSLSANGSVAVPGFMKPEGIIIYHTAAKQYFKVLLESDDKPKGISA